MKMKKTGRKPLPTALSIALMVGLLLCSRLMLASPGDSALQKNASTSAEQTEKANIAQKETRAEDGLEKPLCFRSRKLLESHYEKHGKEMGFQTPEAYEAAAASVIKNPNVLHKQEKEDGDDVYYLEETNAFVIVSPDGYIRTYYYPADKKSYFDRQ